MPFHVLTNGHMIRFLDVQLRVTLLGCTVVVMDYVYVNRSYSFFLDEILSSYKTEREKGVVFSPAVTWLLADVSGGSDR